MPADDWQFWVVTVLCLIGVGFLARPFLPQRNHKRGGKGQRQKRVHLTIEKKRP
jgi:hypothetical protein